jgi:hypothetical protein
MRLIHQGDLVAALAAIDARHAELHQGRLPPLLGLSGGCGDTVCLA